MRSWNAALARHGLVAGAGVARCRTTSSTARQYLHARRTLVRLLELGCVPIINENDAIANDEMRYGDNDRLAAARGAHAGRRPAACCSPTSTACTRPTPGVDPDGRARRHGSTADDPLLSIRADGGGSGRGSGGMASKLDGGAHRLVVGRAAP